MHPILHKIKAHNGVDYAARRNTPIKASGEGVISFAGWKSGYGRTLEIRHGGNRSADPSIDQLIGAGANMSPGSQIRALTAKSAKANNTTMSAGNTVDRKKATGRTLKTAFCSMFQPTVLRGIRPKLIAISKRPHQPVHC